MLESSSKIAAIAERPTREALEMLRGLPSDQQQRALDSVVRTLWENREGAGYVLQRLQDRLRQQVAVRLE